MRIAYVIVTIAALLLLVACATPQVKTNEAGNLTLFAQSPACAVGEPGGVQSQLYFQAEEHCRTQNKQVEIVKSEGKAGIPFVRCASATLGFKCVSK